MDVLIVAIEGGCDERGPMAGRVRIDEERFRGQGPPVPADGAEAADVSLAGSRNRMSKSTSGGRALPCLDLEAGAR